MNNSDNDLEILEEFTYSILKDLKSLEPDISQLVDGYFWHLVVQNLKKINDILQIWRNSRRCMFIYMEQ